MTSRLAKFSCAAILIFIFGNFLFASKLEPKIAQVKHAAEQIPTKTKRNIVGPWQAPAGTQQIPIWRNEAPDMSNWASKAENVVNELTPDALSSTTSQSVYDVNRPTVTVIPPKGPTNGAAIIVFPGGGFKGLAVTIEGTEICDWITTKGMTCILSKYRVPDTNHHYDPSCNCGVTPKILRALQDAQRTVRFVRYNAKQLHLDPEKIGVMGFSAGGYLVAQTSNIFEPAYQTADEIDQISSRPNFAIAFFPGHLCRPNGRLDPSITVTAKTPPTFLLQAWDDPVDPICNSTLYARALNQAGVRSEVHLFATGGHAFGRRRARSPDSIWPALLENWLRDEAVLP